LRNPVAGNSQATALKVDNLFCSYGGVRAVNGVSFEVPAGAFYGLVGPNGAGKSTLIDCISGLNRKYSGGVWVGGTPVARMLPHHLARRGLGRTFQTSRVFRRMTVMSNLMVGGRHQIGERLVSALFGGWKAQQEGFLARAVSLLDLFEIRGVADSYGAELSGGQERLVEISRLMMSRPTVVLLDEPFAGVSPSNRLKLADQLHRLSVEHQVTLLMVEHRLEWVEMLCSNLYVMAQGRLIAEGTMTELRRDHAVVAAYLGDARDAHAAG
jgi:branched-chain amino acid transport system ATP-binding protein